MPSGGSRPRTEASRKGRPKGTTGIKHASTISKEASRELVRQTILKHLDELMHAQVENAKGLKYLVTRQKTTGKFIRVTEAMARVKQGDDEETIEVWEKDPSVQAFTDLMNRALDKPKEQEADVKVTGKLVVEIAKPW